VAFDARRPHADGEIAHFDQEASKKNNAGFDMALPVDREQAMPRRRSLSHSTRRIVTDEASLCLFMRAD
jgi:hypothetical protein